MTCLRPACPSPAERVPLPTLDRNMETPEQLTTLARALRHVSNVRQDDPLHVLTGNGHCLAGCPSPITRGLPLRPVLHSASHFGIRSGALPGEHPETPAPRLAGYLPAPGSFARPSPLVQCTPITVPQRGFAILYLTQRIACTFFLVFFFLFPSPLAHTWSGTTILVRSSVARCTFSPFCLAVTKEGCHNHSF